MYIYIYIDPFLYMGSRVVLQSCHSDDKNLSLQYYVLADPFPFSHVERLKWFCSVNNVILLVIVHFVTICFEAQSRFVIIRFVIVRLVTVFVL